MDYHACRETQGEKSEFMNCMLCEQQLTCIKLDTIKKHISRKHQDLSLYSDARKRAIISKYTKDKVKQRDSLLKMIQPSKLVTLAPYKLALIIGQRKIPLSHSTAFIDFACAAHPNSEIFSGMLSSALFWSYITGP